MFRALILVLTLTSFQAASFAQAPSPAQTLVDKALGLLEANYYGFKTIDYAKLGQVTDARLTTACAGQERCAFETGAAVLDEALAGLDDGHTFRLNPNSYEQFNANARNAPLLMVGLKFDALPDAPALVVTRVKEDSPALRAGLKRGDVVWAVGGARLETFKSASKAVDAITALEFAGAPFALIVSSGGGAERSVTLTPEALRPWLPSYALRPDGIAVITFYQYLTNGLIANRVHEFVRQAQSSNAKAVILDVRGSGGGSAFESIASAGAFVEPIGVSFQNKYGSGLSRFEGGAIQGTGYQISNPVKWTGPVVVLSNHISRSAAEYMTYFLQRTNRAKVFGEPTAGVLNTSTSVIPLPDGSAIAVTSGRSSDLNGVPHPERVTPDVTLTDDMSALSRGRDVVLDRAVQFLTTP